MKFSSGRNYVALLKAQKEKCFGKYDKVEEPCVRIHARITTCVPDSRIKDSSRDGFCTKGISRQLSAIKKRGKQETRREEVQGGG